MVMTNIDMVIADMLPARDLCTSDEVAPVTSFPSFPTMRIETHQRLHVDTFPSVFY